MFIFDIYIYFEIKKEALPYKPFVVIMVLCIFMCLCEGGKCSSY